MSYRPYQSIIDAATSASSGSQRISVRNESGATISYLQPVSIDSNGTLKSVDVSSESDSIKSVGLAMANIPNMSDGDILISGRFENISTSINFGDYVYISKSGGLTESLPTEGVNGFVAGDYVVRVGVIARNATNPSQKDLLVSIMLVGQL